MSEHAHAEPSTVHPDHKKSYFRVFWVLLALTLAEVGLSYFKVDKRLIAVGMVGLALTKAAFVGLYYMHLKYEKRSLLWLAAIPLPLAAFYALFLMMDAGNLIRSITLPWTGGH